MHFFQQDRAIFLWEIFFSLGGKGISAKPLKKKGQERHKMLLFLGDYICH